MRKCIEWKDVSRQDGKTSQRCAKYMDIGNADVLVPGEDNNLGLVVPEPIRGLARIKMDEVVNLGVPIAVGAFGNVVGTLLARRFGGSIHPFVSRWAPVFGILGGVLASIPLQFWKGRRAMVIGAVSSAVTGLLFLTKDAIEGMFSGGMGMLVSQPVGMLPRVAETTTEPGAVVHRTDVGAWGQVV
jgi:hypothetical protein